MARLIVTSGVGDIIAPSVHRYSQLLDTNQARSQAGALKRESPITAVLVTIQGVSHGAFPSLTSLQVLIAESMRTRPPSKLS